MLERIAYKTKYTELENAAQFARDRIDNFDQLVPIDKASKILMSYASHYLKNFASMSAYSRRSANAQMAAFVKKVAPELEVDLEVEIGKTDHMFRFDLVIKDKDNVVVVETRESPFRNSHESSFDDEAAISQLSQRLYASGLKNGIVFFYPSCADEIIVMTTANSAWPRDLNLREVFSDDANHFPDEGEYEDPVSLVDEHG